ncbi:TonB-dependent receptor [Thiohalorhabdus sp. Cl-TMA]|uniref:TonB-dependent receptor n=1 Tax=Thiohalorhabdus methylotrophus TaxID=3242694 RepID=A0ABV4TWH0_9GAMM
MLLLALSGLAVAPGQALADSEDLESITVTTTRTSQGRSIADIPGSVTVIDREEIEKQTRTTQDLGEILSNLVPGLGQSSESLTNYGQQMRGRSFLVMIDGVPQNAVLRQAFKHLRSVSPGAIERIEVIRGAVATYGAGSTGGIINFITKSGQGLDGTEMQTTVGVTGQMEDSDSFGGRLYQAFRGDTGAFDYSVNLSVRDTGSWYDGEGDLIPPNFGSQGGGLAESREYNLQTKLGYQLTPDQRLRLAINYYDHAQDAEHRRPGETDPGRGNPDTDEATQALDEEPEGIDPGTENLNISLDHTWQDLLGGTLSTQVYHQDYRTDFGYYPYYTTGAGQTYLETQHTGVRLAHDRSIGQSANAVYGIDVGTETSSQSFVDGRTSVGELDQVNYAPFLQLQANLGQDWLVRGGVRHERVQIDVPTFQDEGWQDSHTVLGGKLSYSETVFNAGLVHYLTNRQELFASFSQGFSVADIGRQLRTKSADIDNEIPAGNDIEAEDFESEAKVVDNYEIGWRGRFNAWRASASAYYSVSDQGATFGGPPNFPLLRRKEQIYGVELTADVDATRALRLGGTASWQEGRVDTDSDGDTDEYLDGTRIAPPELTLYGEYAPTERWSARLQAKQVFDRDRFDSAALPASDAFAKGKVDGYTLVDASGRVEVGPGSLEVGINNLLDEQYITPLGQAYNLAGYVFAGRGRTLSASYSVTY